MRIGIDIRTVGRSRTGDESVFFNLTRALLQIESTNIYFLLTDQVDEAAQASLRERFQLEKHPNATLLALDAPNRFMWNAWSLPRALKKHAMDLYHTQYIAPLWLPEKVKLVTHIHDVSFRAHPEWIGILDRFFLSSLIPRSLSRSQAIIAPSQFTADEIKKYYPTESTKIEVIPNALADEWSLPIDENDRKKLHATLSLSGPYLVSIGTMQPRKNIALLIQAFEKVKKRLPEASLVLVGNPNGHHVDPRVQAASQKKIPGLFFPGYLETPLLKALLSESAGLVFPSLYEGFGIPLLEALSVGVPVAASDLPVMHEVIRERALFFDPMSLAALENALYTLYIDSKEKTHPLGLGKAELDRFSWNKSALSLLSLYMHL